MFIERSQSVVTLADKVVQQLGSRLESWEYRVGFGLLFHSWNGVLVFVHSFSVSFRVNYTRTEAGLREICRLFLGGHQEVDKTGLSLSS